VESKFNNAQDSVVTSKNGIVLSLIALGLDLVAIFLIALNSLGLGLPSVVILFIVLLPLLGLMTGIACLAKGKKRMGKAAKAIAIIAIALPLSFVGFVLVLFIGVATGMIPLM
jgi:ABC-type dipeptide/oligopeptide/nickel transport system permease component